MKKIFKSLTAIILVCCIFSLNLLSAQAIYNEFLSENGIEVTKTKYVTTVKKENITTKTMSESALKSLKNNLDKQSLTEHEKNIEIMRTLGYHEKTIATMPSEEIDLMMNDTVNLQVQVVYMKANADGTTSVISEDECLAAVAAREAALATASDNDGWDAWTSDDGYMRMTVSSNYIDPASVNNQKGWYYMHVWYEWLTAPMYRMKDAMSIAVPNCIWEDLDGENAFYASITYDMFDTNGLPAHSDGYSKTTQDLTIEDNGIYYEWQMPVNGSNVITYIQFYTRVKVRVRNFTSSQNIGIHLKYVHAYSVSDVLDTSYTWTSEENEIGVSLVPQWIVYSDEFYHNYSHEYNP